jgi:ABC-2 type transport system ATP-binding protein
MHGTLTVVRFDGVWLRYGRSGPWVLEAVELNVAPGEAAIVVGRNGAGKSTLLQIAVGALMPTRGVVRDRPAVVGWVPERFPADQPFTARRYLRRMGAIRGLSSARVTNTIERWSDQLGLAPYLDHRLNTLSKGTAQKVGLIQALHAPPGLFVLDEPWEGLDAQTREQVPAMVADVLGRGGSVLISDHRGETVRLPSATVWRVVNGAVTVEPAGTLSSAAPDSTVEWVVEVAVAASDPSAAEEQLRAAGHRVLGVHPEPVLREGTA